MAPTIPTADSLRELVSGQAVNIDTVIADSVSDYMKSEENTRVIPDTKSKVKTEPPSMDRRAAVRRMERITKNKVERQGKQLAPLSQITRALEARQVN